MIRLSETAQLYNEDCREAIKRIPDNSIDSCVTDPPYALVSTLKRFANSPRTEASMPTSGPHARASRGFMGQTWDTGETAFSAEFWAEVYRVLKPGALVAAFGASRGYHRMACAIEDAGFEIRDSLMWIYGTGFPKSHDVSKGIDKHFDAEREVLGQRTDGRYANPLAVSGRSAGILGEVVEREAPNISKPVTPEAAQWEGWGTALKPAFEPIVLARKPLSENTVAANVLKWGTGAINIDGCRVNSMSGTSTGSTGSGEFVSGRFPANVVHDGSDEVVGMFPGAGGGDKRGRGNGKRPGGFGNIGADSGDGEPNAAVYADSGSAARFFYSAKASKADRNGSKHPTVKPISLMEWLATLVTPPGGTILDPFAGSGTTGAAARNKGFNVILCEREAEYIEDIKARFGFIESPLAPCPVPALVLSPPPY